MSQVEIRENVLRASFEGADIARTRRLSLEIPIGVIRAVAVGIPAVALREPASFWGSYDVGTMLVGNEDSSSDRRESFYEVRHPERALTLELDRGRFEYVVLEPTNLDAAALVAQLQAILGHSLPTAALPPGLMSEVHPVEPAPQVHPVEPAPDNAPAPAYRTGS